ncbi:hypothetical protein DPMN_110568 [Dreissena polymorpha]|uniref:Uncharacterized protein n=1 Tax=Dreissena polymorpha TaxID=45954 RepID=A0A9D4KCB2_DREPO|nr:hypothetical protein DPMN_110568 [Dreissena polymorpha]
MNRESPGRTGNDRRGTGNNRDGTGNNRRAPGTTGTAPSLHRGPYRPRQSYDNAPVNGVRVPALCRNATGIHQGSAGALPATTGVKPGLPVVLRYTGALPDFTGAQPGHYRRQPGLCRDAAGFHRGTTGDNRGSAGASPG